MIAMIAWGLGGGSRLLNGGGGDLFRSGVRVDGGLRWGDGSASNYWKERSSRHNRLQWAPSFMTHIEISPIFKLT